MLSTSYFHHMMPHHLSMDKSNIVLAPLPGENTRGLTSRGSKHEYFPAGVSALPQIRFPVREALEVLKYTFR